MRTGILLLLTIIFSLSAQAQQLEFHYSNDLKMVTANDDTVAYPFIGGMVAPQFNEVDLNLDGIKDLMVFDRSGNKVLTFLNEGISGEASYFYAPQYEEYFPKMSSWVLMRDYNCDGKMDIFAHNPGSSIMVYKNTSSNGQLEFTHVTDQIKTDDDQPLYALSLDIPVIDDIDGDGDLDFLSFGVLGGYIEMYRNERVEDTLSCDSLRFKYVDYCWGSFAEAGLNNDVFLGDNCFGFKFYKNKLHAGSTILTFDADEDGDKEVLIGDVDFGDFKFLTNGKVENSWPYDTMISTVTGYPQNKPVFIYKFPAAYYLDLNNDGVKDLIASSNEAVTASNTYQNWWYRNSGKDDKPTFNFVDSNFLMDASLDFGSRTTLSFLDVDGDGDEDLLVSHRGNYYYTNNDADRIYLYERLGQDSSTHFKLKDTDYLGFASENKQGLHPAFGDLNGDGKPDMVVGYLNGKMSYYTNSGSTTPSFTMIEDTLADIDVGNLATPFIYDLDGDNLKDLVVGSEAGTIRFFKNKGTATNPMFSSSADVDSVGKILVNSFFYSPVYDSAFNIVDSTRYFEFTGNSAPWISDLNDDGTPEIITGARNGLLHVHEIDKNNLTDSFIEVTDYFYFPKSGKKAQYDAGGMSRVACSDVNGDGFPDMLIGSGRGGLQFLSSKMTALDSIVNSVAQLPELGSRIYPNPSRSEVFVETSEAVASPIEVELIDLFGRSLKSYVMPAGFTGRLRMNTSGLAAGTYFIRLHADGHKLETHRLVVIR